MPGIPLDYLSKESTTVDSNLQQSALKFSTFSKLRKSFFRKRISFFIFFAILLLGLFSFYRFSKMSNSRHSLAYIKQPHSDFVGRKNHLEALKEMSISKKKIPVPVTVLWGESGIGKSEIAITFANQEIKHFSLVFSIDASSQETYQTSYHQLATLLDISIDPGKPISATVRKIHAELEHQKSLQPWLLIFDNAEENFDLPRRGEGAIIITTRNLTPWQQFPYLEVLPFSEEDALFLLEKITRKKGNPHHLSLIRELDYFPLILNFAAHYITEVPGMTEEKYLQLLHKNNISLIETFPHGKYLLSSWRVIAEQIQQKNPKALEWLHFCSYLSSEGIPLSWLEEWLEESDYEDDVFLRKAKAYDILHTLVNQSLLRYFQNAKKISLHRLNQEVFQKDQYFTQSMQDKVITFLVEHVEKLEEVERIDALERNINIWPKLADWEPHAIKMLNLYSTSNEKTACIQNILGNWKCVRGEYEQAKQYFEEALKTRQSLWGNEDPRTLISMINLAWDLWKLGEFQDSQKFYEQALAIQIKIHGLEHPDVAITMNNMSLVFRDRGEYEEMRRLNKTVLELRKKIYPPNHPYIGDSMHNLAQALWRLNHFAEAESYFENSLEIYRKSYKEEHPYIAITTHSLARVLVCQKKYHQAEKSYRHALSLYSKLYSPEHPYVSTCLNHLGKLLEILNKPSEALLCYVQAFTIDCHTFSQKNSFVVKHLENLIECLRQPSNQNLLPKIRKEVYPLCVKILGESHPLTIALLSVSQR